jgi:DNA ligase 1
MLKPHLACDLDESKLKFPLIGLPKIDGVRGINLDGTIKQRSLKPIPNKFLTAKYSGDEFIGFDGELALTGKETAWDLCRTTTSAVRRASGEPDVEWHLFDYLHPDVLHLGYEDRLKALARKIADNFSFYVSRNIKFVSRDRLDSLQDFLNFENWCMEAGYEGVIVRDPEGMHKSGRATVKVGAYMRRKPFVDFEGIIVSFEEALENQNEAKTNELGRSERSTHQENMVPKGMIGNITMQALADVVYMDKVLIQKGQLVTVGPGELPHDLRKHYFDNPGEFTGQIGKAKFFAHGQKDKPRMPTFISLRDAGDMVDE